MIPDDCRQVIVGSLSATAAYISGNTEIFHSFAPTVLTKALTGTKGITKYGPTTLTLSNLNNTYRGPTTINTGTLAISSGTTISPNTVVSIGSGDFLSFVGNTTNQTILGLSGGSGFLVTNNSTQATSLTGLSSWNLINNPSTGRNYKLALDFGNATPATINGLSFITAGGTGTQNGISWNMGAPNIVSDGGAGVPVPTSGNSEYDKMMVDFAWGYNPAFLIFTGLTPNRTYELYLYTRVGYYSQTNSPTITVNGGVYTFPNYNPAQSDFFKIQFNSINTTTATLNISVSPSNFTAFFYGLTLEDLGSVTETITNITLSGANNYTFTGGLSGNLNLTKTGTNTQVISGTSGITGNVSVLSGALQLGELRHPFGNSYNGNITNNSTFISNTSANQTFAGLMSGSGSFIKDGSGILTLNSANTYTGTTSISGGRIKQGIANALPRGTSSIWYVASGASFDFNGSSANLPYTLRGFGSMVNTSVNGLDLNQGVQGGIWDTEFNDVSGGAITFIVGNGAGYLLNNPTQNFRGLITLANGYLGCYNLNINQLGGGDIQISNLNTAPTIEYFGSTNTTTASGRNLNIFGTATGGGGTIKNSGTGVITWGGAYVSAPNVTKTLTLDGTNTGNNTLVGNVSAVATSILNITKTGTGKWLLAGNNTYTGITTINNGTLGFYSSNAFGNGGNITFTGGSMQYGNGATTDISSRIRSSTSPVIIDTNGQNVTFSSNLNTNSGGFTKTGNGTLTVSTPTTYTGTTTVSGGILATSGGSERLPDSTVVTVLSGATLRLGGDETLTSISGQGTFDLVSYRLIFGSDNASRTVGGIIGTGGSITKLGTGTLTLSSNSSDSFTYTGTTNISAGNLIYGNELSYPRYSTVNQSANTNVGISLGGSGAIDWTPSDFETLFNTGTIFNLTIPVNNTLAVDTTVGNATVSTDLTASRNLTKLGTNTLTFGGTNTNTGTIFVSGGGIATNGDNKLSDSSALVLATGTTLTLGGNDSIGSLAGSGNTNLSNFSLSANSDNSSTSYNGIMSGTGGSVFKIGSGTLALAGSNTYTGGTAVTSGTLAINSTTAIGTGSLTFRGGSIDNTTASAITLTNNNTQNWNENFTFVGTRNLNLGTGAVTMNSSRTVSVSSNTLTVGGAIAGTGLTLTKNGGGTLLLTGASTYTGTTFISAGTLQLGDGSQLSTTTSLASPSIVTANVGTFIYGVRATNDSTLIANLPLAYFSGNGSLGLISNAGFYNLTSNVTITSAFSIQTQKGLVNSGLRANGANRTITASSINFNGILGEVAAGSRTITFSTSAVNGPITVNAQFGSPGRLYIHNLIANAGTGPVNITGFSYNGSAFITATGAISSTATFTANGVLTFNATANSIISGNTTMTSSTTNVFNVSDGVTFNVTGILAGTNSAINKTGLGTLALGSVAHTYTGATSISQGSITVSKTTGGITGNATFTPTNLTVDFANVTPTSTSTYRFFSGSTSPTGLTVTLTNAGGKTGTYNYTNSTLTIN